MEDILLAELSSAVLYRLHEELSTIEANAKPGSQLKREALILQVRVKEEVLTRKEY